jgi:lysophospholipase L1-like esterase
MADYPYEGQLIADPVSFQRAQSAQVTVYDAADTTNSTPLALKDASGLPTANPLTSSSDAFVKPIYAPSQDIKYVGAGLTVFVSSAKGMRDAAAGAAAAAQEAANSAVAAAADRLATAAVDGAGKLILTKASGATVDAGNVKGAQGVQGPPGQPGSNVLPTDDAIEAAITGVGTKTKAALSATYVPKWKATAAYLAGDAVLSPAGDTVTAKVNFTSGASYDAANWNYSTAYATPAALAAKAGLTDISNSQRIRDDRADQAYNALRTFRRALLARDAAPVNMWHIGDSITVGVSPATTATRWASVLRDRLRLDFPTAGNPVGGFGYYSANAGNNSPVVTTAGVLTSQGSAAFSPDSYVWRAYATGDKQVYTFTGTGADILYIDSAAGNGQAFYWKVDGGAATNVVTDLAYTAPKRVQVRGLTAGVHTIEVGWAVGNGITYSSIAGIVAYNGDEDKGFRSIAAGIAGGTSTTWNAMATGPYEFAKLFAPDLVTIALGTNDAGGTVPVAVATYKSNIQSIISKIKARTTGKVPSFVILFPAEIYKAAPLAPWADYRAAAYEIAAADPDNVTVMDWGLRLNPVPTFNSTLGGLLHTDYVHPTAAGHAYIASMQQRFLPTGG